MKLTVSNEAKIIVLKRESNHKPGTLAAREFALLLKSKTVGEYRAKSKDTGYLRGEMKRGTIKVKAAAAGR